MKSRLLIFKDRLIGRVEIEDEYLDLVELKTDEIKINLSSSRTEISGFQKELKKDQDKPEVKSENIEAKGKKAGEKIKSYF